MNPFYQSLEEGHSPEEILGYISKAIPKMAPAIRKATSSGYTLQQVLGYLSKVLTPQKSKGISESQIHENNRISDAQMVKHGLTMAGGIVAAPAVASTLNNALSRALPNSLKKLSNLGTSLGAASEGIQSGNTPAMTSQNVPAVAPTQQSPQSATQSLNPLSTQQPPVQSDNIPKIEQKSQTELFGNAKKYLEGLGILDTVKERLARGNTPEAVAASFNIKRSGEAKIDPDLLKNIESYSKEVPQEELKNTKFDLPKEPPKIEKTSIVSTPQGIGEVKEIRNGKSIVDINGKMHKFDEEDLEGEPEEISALDLEPAVSDYLSRIPESQKSSVIDVSLYDPETQELQVRFPNGDQWVYGPVPEEIFEKINSMTGISVSSGESTLRGTIWEKGVENSAGADFYKLIKKLVREGKVKERKLKTGIDLFKGFTRVKKRK